MKLRYLLGGVAALAMVGSAQADDFSQSSASGSFNLPVIGNVSGTLTTNQDSVIDLGFYQIPIGDVAADLGRGANAVSIAGGGEEVASWIEIQGSSEGNVGTISESAAATFTLTGDVDAHCMYYTGNVDQTLDFGTLGIIALDSIGVDNAFDMVDDAEASIETNVAGCNTANNVSISKNDVRGMVNNAPGSYDQTQFTANLPYTVDANWTGVANGAGAVNGTPQSLALGLNANAANSQQGAWKSHFEMDINIPAPALSLVAGTYTGYLTVDISVL